MYQETAEEKKIAKHEQLETTYFKDFCLLYLDENAASGMSFLSSGLQSICVKQWCGIKAPEGVSTHHLTSTGHPTPSTISPVYQRLPN